MMHSEKLEQFIHQASRGPRIALAVIAGTAAYLLGVGTDASAQLPDPYYLRAFSLCEYNPVPGDPTYPNPYPYVIIRYHVPRPLGLTMMFNRSETGENYPLYKRIPGEDVLDSRREDALRINRPPWVVPFEEGGEYSVLVFQGTEMGLDATQNGYAPVWRTSLQIRFCRPSVFAGINLGSV